MMISDALISSEKMTEVFPWWMEHERMKSSASVDLPTPGRAATMIICPACRPLVSLSKSMNPVGTPASRAPPEAIMVSSSMVGLSRSDSGR